MSPRAQRSDSPELATDDQMTVEEFLAFVESRPNEERWELIEGRPVLQASPSKVHQIIARNGFMETPNVRAAISEARNFGLVINFDAASYFLSLETVVPRRGGAMAFWRKWLFARMARNAQRATDFFQLPPNRVVELGMQVEL